MDANLEIKDGTKSDITVTRPRWPIETTMIRAALEASSSTSDAITNSAKAATASE